MAYTRRSRIANAGWVPENVSASVGASITYYPVELLNLEVAQIGALGGGLTAGSSFLTGPVHGDEMAAISLRKYLLPKNTTLKPPSWGPLARAAGMEEASVGTPATDAFSYFIDSGTKPNFKTDSTAGSCDPLDITVNRDRHLTKALACVGNCIFDFQAGQIPTIQFDGIGKVNQSGTAITASTEAAVTADGGYDEIAVPFTIANFSIDWNSGSYSGLTCAGITIDLGAQIAPQPDVAGVGGYATAQITGYNPSMTLSIRETDYATINWETIMRSTSRLIEFTATHQRGGGNRLELTINCFGRLSGFPPLVDRDGILYRDINLTVDPRDAGFGIFLTYTSA